MTRFAELKKLPDAPASRMLADVSAKLETPVKAPANASVTTVLEELAKEGAWVDAIRLMSVALPARECVWWACLAGRDIAGDKGTPSLKAAEKWVFEPNDANREVLQKVIDAADVGDATKLAATAALFAPGNMGPSDQLKDIEAPPGALANCAFGLNMQALKAGDDVMAQMQLILERALDIARGGNGKVDPPPPLPLGPQTADAD